MSDLADGIQRAKELLITARHATMATVNDDGSPHNSPFLFLHDDKLAKLFWSAQLESLHSQNIIRTGQLFVVVYDMHEGGGLYIKAENGHPLEGTGLQEALNVYNVRRKMENKSLVDVAFYSGDSDKKLWSADIVGLWVNGADIDENDRVLEDYRTEILAKDLF